MQFNQPDTLIPEPYNPQSLNRFSYVNNNPVRYTDPTGHMRVADQDMQVNHASMSCSKYPQYCNNGKPKSSDELVKMRNKPDKVIENGKSPLTNPIESYCGNSSGLACLANATQDIATGIDLVGVGFIETPAVAEGCVEGGPMGCAVAEVGVIVIWNTTLNNAETAASLASFGFTVADDFLNNGGWGENSATSLTTLLAGQLPLTPSWDLAVDTYSSGYNHGFFNGVHSLVSNGLYKP